MVSWSVHDDWKKWFTEIYLPDILSTGCFTHYQLVKLMDVDEEEGPTYAVQLHSPDHAGFNRYKQKHLSEFREKEKSAWGDSVCSFPSLMEVIN